MRPQSIMTFERLYLGAWLVGVINTGLSWGRNQEMIQASGAVADIGAGALYATTAVGFVIPLLLWYFIARRASIVAKWILIALFAMGLIGIVYAGTQGSLAGGLSGILAGAALLLQMAAIYMLFRPDARAWLGEGVAQ